MLAETAGLLEVALIVLAVGTVGYFLVLATCLVVRPSPLRPLRGALVRAGVEVLAAGVLSIPLSILFRAWAGRDRWSLVAVCGLVAGFGLYRSSLEDRTSWRATAWRVLAVLGCFGGATCTADGRGVTVPACTLGIMAVTAALLMLFEKVRSRKRLGGASGTA